MWVTMRPSDRLMAVELLFLVVAEAGLQVFLGRHEQQKLLGQRFLPRPRGRMTRKFLSFVFVS